nr:hypothetical protein [Tanacetum cinerariifolium]
MLESTPPYTSWALLRSGKHRNSKKGLAHVVVTGWKQGDWVAHWNEEIVDEDCPEATSVIDAVDEDCPEATSGDWVAHSIEEMPLMKIVQKKLLE